MREIIRAGTEIVNSAFDQSGDVAEKLDEAEKKIEILIKKEDGTIETAPFDATEQTPETQQNEKQELF